MAVEQLKDEEVEELKELFELRNKTRDTINTLALEIKQANASIRCIIDKGHSEFIKENGECWINLKEGILHTGCE